MTLNHNFGYFSGVGSGIAGNVLQISEGTNSLALCEGIWAFAYVLLSDALLSE
jgi:hypothetical protein